MRKEVRQISYYSTSEDCFHTHYNVGDIAMDVNAVTFMVWPKERLRAWINFCYDQMAFATCDKTRRKYEMLARDAEIAYDKIHGKEVK